MKTRSQKARASRRKGYRAENELVNICRNHGFNVKRTPLSLKPDLTINFRPVSVKRRKNGLKWCYAELGEHDYVLFRSDGMPWLKIKPWLPEDREVLRKYVDQGKFGCRRPAKTKGKRDESESID